MKRHRRIAIGPFVTLVFENTDTMRWQVQEMARVERMLRDEQIAHTRLLGPAGEARISPGHVAHRGKTQPQHAAEAVAGLGLAHHAVAHVARRRMGA
mgnify:CR=1 FL=1